MNELQARQPSAARAARAASASARSSAPAPPMQEVFRKVEKVAPTDISRADHRRDRHRQGADRARAPQPLAARGKGPFVTINCGAIPENLLESELFGHVKGAFTGAVANKPGKFQAADGGTLFLDEIGEMPLELQVKLLRALQERVVVPRRRHRGPSRSTSASSPRPTATSRRRSKAGAFREDLYYRLNVVNLAAAAAARARRRHPRARAATCSARYAARVRRQGARASRPNADRRDQASTRWPGNIRELENRIKKAVVLADKALLGARGPRTSRPTTCRRSCRSPRPRRSSSATTSTRCSRSTTATAPRPRATSASTRAPSSGTWSEWTTSPPDREEEPRVSAGRLAGLLLGAAVLLPACLLPQEDHIIQPLPPLMNQPAADPRGPPPARRAGSSPSATGATVRTSPSWPPSPTRTPATR